MPKSKKPRKKHRRISIDAGMRAANALTSILIRGNAGWTRAEETEFGLAFLEPMAAIRYSRAKDDIKPYFAGAKSELVFAYGMAQQIQSDGDRAKIMKMIETANQHLQTSFNVWAKHQRLLYPNIKEMRRLASLLLDEFIDRFEPYQIQQQRYSMGKREKFYDRVEQMLDSKLSFKEKNYV